MFRPKNPQPTSFRLPKLQTILKDSDLQFLLQEAGNRPGITIELPFLTGTRTYMLTVKLDSESYEPMWSYYRGDDDRAQMLWQHPTGDINLVLNLCAGETGQEGADYTSVSAIQHMHHLHPAVVDAPKQTSNQPTLSAAADTLRMTGTTTGSGPLPGKIASLEGDLSNMQIPTLLQSINMSKMTGMLQITQASTVASIYFEDGVPTHAESPEATGDQAIVELITWEEGEFHFYPNDRKSDRTVKRRVDALLMEGVTLLDQNKYVKEQGLKPTSYLIRAHERITEDQFKQALTKGAPLDFETQKRFYGFIDNISTLIDVLRRMPMIKIEWVPIMFNLLSCGLVKLSDTPPAGMVPVAPLVNLPPYEIDRVALQSVLKSITRQETGLFTYPAFLFMLEQEFSKAAALGMPLSLIVFEPKLRVGDASQPFPMQYVRELVRRIESVKRPFDVLGHFETFDYALYMPNTQLKGAKVFAARLMEMFSADPFVPRPLGVLTMFFGISSAPEDTMELPVLLSAAREGKRRSVETGSPVHTLRELGPR
jgi:hypothetical protein